MIGEARVLGVIPARGGSKGIPGKNIRDFCGKPLLAWTIEAAKASRSIDRLILSSDSQEIIGTAVAWGCEVPFVRPPELASDTTPGIDVVLHATNACPGYDYVVLLQPTSPFRTTADIDSCLNACLSGGFPAMVSVSDSADSPHWMYTIREGGTLQPLLGNGDVVPRRQELPPVYALNGAVYVARCDWLRKVRTFLHADTGAYRMPVERSLDLDTPLDWIAAVAWMEYLQSDRPIV